MLMTFHPHPLTIQKPEKFVGLITPLHVKRRLIEEAGIDVLFIVPFTDEFTLINPELFVDSLLMEKSYKRSDCRLWISSLVKEERAMWSILPPNLLNMVFFFEIRAAITLDGESSATGSER